MHCSNWWRMQAAPGAGMARDCKNLSDFGTQEGVLILILEFGVLWWVHRVCRGLGVDSV